MVANVLLAIAIFAGLGAVAGTLFDRWRNTSTEIVVKIPVLVVLVVLVSGTVRTGQWELAAFGISVVAGWLLTAVVIPKFADRAEVQRENAPGDRM